MSVCSTDVFTEDLEEAVVESPSADEVHCCDNDSHYITELLGERLGRKGVAMEHTVCHDNIGALVFHQRNKPGSLSHHRRGSIRT